MVKKSFSDAESDMHAVAKYRLYHELLKRPEVTKCQMERDLGTVKPDISAYVGQYPIAVEVQVSNLTIDKIRHRTNEYAQKGIYVLWVCAEYRLTHNASVVDKWVRFLHGMYYGWVFHLSKDGLLTATKLKPNVQEYVSDWGVSRRYLKTVRDIVITRQVNIVDDFKPICRQAFKDYPEAKLWAVK